MSEPGPEVSAGAPPVCYRHADRETYIVCQRCGRPICTDCMRSAAVGFQCPECIKEGARTTRSGRTAYGGRLPRDAAVTSKVLVGINALVWLLVTATGGGSSVWVDRLALSPTTVRFRNGDGTTTLVRGIADSPFGDGGAYWQLLTSMFTHVSLLHIGFNMLALWVLGPSLELALGRARFLALYFLSGLAASATVYWLAPEVSSTLGASGAIFGLMGALLVIAVKVGGQFQQLLGWIGFNFVFTFLVPNISWQGHLGGFLSGGLLAVLLVFAPRTKRSAWQLAGLVLLAVLIAAAVAARTLALQ